jgi:hypothetical protein
LRYATFASRSQSIALCLALSSNNGYFMNFMSI